MPGYQVAKRFCRLLVNVATVQECNTEALPEQDDAMMTATLPPSTLDPVLRKALCAFGSAQIKQGERYEELQRERS
jgi:hypothetical protein